MFSSLEIMANVLNATSILLAGRNSVHTWWTGIAGCALFGVVFFQSRLYADVTLQAFFIVTCVSGWRTWSRRRTGAVRPVRWCRVEVLVALAAAATAVTMAYGWVLHRFTNAYAPYLDSAILAFSVLGQFLLVGRRVESWGCWLAVNTASVPLYVVRGLYITAAFYTAFWINALVALRHWRRLAERTS